MVWGERLNRLFSVRSLRALCWNDSACTTTVTPSTSAIATAVFAPYFVVRCPKSPRKSSTLASSDARTSSTPAARRIHQRSRVIHAGYTNVRIAVASSTPRPR